MPNIRFPLHRLELRGQLLQGDEIIEASMGTPRRRCKGERLVNTGDASGAVYRLISGWAARTRVVEDGRRQIMAVFLPGDMMSIKSMLLERQLDTIECLTDITLRAIEHKRLLELSATHHTVALRLMFQLGEDDRRLHNWVAALGRGNAEERIATLLLDLRGRLLHAGAMDGASFRLAMTQQEIADHLGLTIVHVNRVLRRLREAGIFSLRGGLATIDDMDRLSRLAAPLQDIYERTAQEFGGRAA